MSLPRGTLQPGLLGNRRRVLLSRVGPDSSITTARNEWLFGPTGATNAPAGLASITYTAQTPAVLIALPAGLASITYTAPQPTVTTSGATNAPAGLASITYTAQTPAALIKPAAGLASITYTAQQPAVLVKPAAGVASIVYTAGGVTVAPSGWTWYAQISGSLQAGVILLDGTLSTTTDVT